MKKANLLMATVVVALISLCFTSCQKEQVVTEAYFVGCWHVVKTEHMYMLEKGDSLVSHTITRDLVYEFAQDGILTVTYDGNFNIKSEWSYQNGVLSMPVLHDDIVLYAYNGVWYLDDVTSLSFTAIQHSRATEDYEERYTYYLEKK